MVLGRLSSKSFAGIPENTPSPPLSYPSGGAPWGDPPSPNLSICGGSCLDCIRLPMPTLFLSSSYSVALLKQISSLLLLAYFFSCTFLASRSMIAQVFIFIVKPMENNTFWVRRRSRNRASGEPSGELLWALSGSLRGGRLGAIWSFSGELFCGLLIPSGLSLWLLWVLLSPSWRELRGAERSEAPRSGCMYDLFNDRPVGSGKQGLR